jgi:hypothetical protein
MDITKIRNDKKMFEKVLLAYWYSIPCDNTTLPDKIDIVRDNGTFFNINLIKNGVVFGAGSMQKKEIDKYLEKLEEIKEHELDIIKRLEKEITDTKEKISKKVPKRR